MIPFCVNCVGTGLAVGEGDDPGCGCLVGVGVGAGDGVEPLLSLNGKTTIDEL